MDVSFELEQWLPGMNASGKEGKRLARALGFLQLFIGLGAVAGGLGLVSEPDGSNLGMPLSMLEHSPFPDFLIPGMVLLMVNGLGSIAGSVASFRLFRHAAEIAMVLGAFLVAWLIMQVYWIQTFHWLHALYFVLGITEIFLGWLFRKALRVSDW